MNEIFIKIQTFSWKEMHLQMLSAKSRPSCRWQCFAIQLPPQHRGNYVIAGYILTVKQP